MLRKIKDKKRYRENIFLKGEYFLTFRTEHLLYIRYEPFNATKQERCEVGNVGLSWQVLPFRGVSSNEGFFDTVKSC